MQHEPRALTGLRRDAHGTADLLDHVLHDVETDAAARNLGDRVLHRESGQKQELQELGFTQRARRLTIDQLPFDDDVTRPFQIDAPAVIRDDDLEGTGAVTRLQTYDTLRGLAGRAAFLERLNPMVNGVAQEMAQRRVELDQNVAVHLGGLADDIQSHLLPQRAAQVAHHARKCLNAITERPHAAGERLVVQAV